VQGGDGLNRGFENAIMQDNLLFFGELNGDNQVVFRGERKQSIKGRIEDEKWARKIHIDVR
jgi:hypothetical protein